MTNYKSLSLSFDIVFFFKYIKYFTFIDEKMKKKIKLIFNKKFKTSKWPYILLMYINNIDQKIFHQKIPPISLVLKDVCNFSYFMTSIISWQIYYICWNSPMFVGAFFLNNFLKSKSNPIYFKQTKIIQNVMFILT